VGPRSCYDEGKRCAETLFFDYHRQYGVDIRIGRIFNTYGPRMHPNDGRVVSNFIVQALKGEPITVYGKGQQTRSFCYVDDLVEGFLRFMRSTARCPARSTSATRASSPSCAGRAGDQHHQQQLADRVPAAARRRPAATPPRHHHRARAARLGTRRAAARRAGAHDRLLRRAAHRRRLTRPWTKRWPTDVGERWLAAMRAGDWEAAWRQTDRLELPRRAAQGQPGFTRAPAHLTWDGTPFDGRVVRIRCEHGLGDTLQFLRFVPLVTARAASCT
jgi:hypothetical protein